MLDDQTKKDMNKFQTLPQKVQDFLMDDKSTEANIKIIEKFKLTPAEEDLFFDLTDKVIYKEVKLGDFLAEVNKNFKFDDKKAKDFALDIFGTIFLPIDSYLGDAQGEIKKMGATAGNFAVEKIKTEELPPDILIKRILAETDIKLDDAMFKKLKEIAMSRFRGARDEAETLETLMRGKKLGGLELSGEDAKKISANFEAKLKSVKLVGYLVSNSIIEEETQQKPVKKADLAFGAEDEREALYIKHQLEKRGVETKTDFGEGIKKSTEKIAKYGKITFTDENLKNKFSNIVSARLRDVRDEMETLEILTRDKGVGGLGLSTETAKKISSLIETEFQLLSEARKSRELQKYKEWEKSSETEKAQKEEKIKIDEQRKLDEKFRKIVNVSPKARQKFYSQNSGEQVVKAEDKLQESSTTELVAPNFSQKKMGASGKPLVEDISFTPKLLGPIEEIRKMTLADFRRFGKNPETAAEKIKDKIDLLEDESHLKKIEGIRAWRESEPSRIYFEIMRQCFNDGKSIDEIIATRNAGKIPSLTPDEFKAVMKLSEMTRV